MMKKIKEWLYSHITHFWAWALFIFYECAVVIFLFDKPGAFPAYVIHYSLIITFFYLHAHVILPWALKKKGNVFWRLIFSLSVELTVFVLLYFSGDILLMHAHVKLVNGIPHLDYSYAIRNIYREVYYLGYASAYYFLTTYMKERKKAEDIERQRLTEIINRQRVEQELTRAQNAFLKAQINPHFLFNTLDFVYHNVTELSPKAADAIITLSEMMRYAIDADKMGEFILLGDELEQVQNLQYLNHLRKNEDIPLKVIYADEVRNISFIPLVLLTLTENIFKHGNLQNGREAIVELYIENGSLVITTDNVSNRIKQSTSHNTGLVNIEKRLKYAYGDDIYFDHHQDEDGHFRLIIKVPVRLLNGGVVPPSVLADAGPM